MPKSKRKDKVEVMQGQTEEERRELRREQRLLLDKIGDKSAEMTSLESEAFSNVRSDNNSLFKKVKYTRELNHDGDNMMAISDLAMKRSAQLAHSVRQYSGVSQALGKKYGGDWAALGKDVAALFATVPELEFLAGPLQKPEKPKKVVQRKKKVVEDLEGEETKFETMEGGVDAAHEEATNLRLQNLVRVLEAQGARDESKDLMTALVNPNCFHQTVENFFDLSFLVKDARAGLAVEDGVPTLKLTEPPEEVTDKFQGVIVLSQNDIKEAAKLWNIDRALLQRPMPDSAE